MRSILVMVVAMVLLAKTSYGAVQTREVKYTVDGQNYQGYFAYDDATDEKRPGILVFPEWWGVTDYAEARARQLAELGYAALAVDIYGDAKTVDKPDVAGKLSGDLKQHPERLAALSDAALKVLRQQPPVDAEQIGAIGYCFGGYAALELARSGAPLAAVVTFHGDLGTKNPDGAKNIKAKVLVLNGGDDPYVTAEDLEKFKQRMRDAGVDWQLISYGGALHSFSNPDSDHYGLDGIGYNKSADHRSWEAMKAFFQEVFRK